jgi:hypothetical protein
MWHVIEEPGEQTGRKSQESYSKLSMSGKTRKVCKLPSPLGGPGRSDVKLKAFFCSTFRLDHRFVLASTSSKTALLTRKIQNDNVNGPNAAGTSTGRAGGFSAMLGLIKYADIWRGVSRVRQTSWSDADRCEGYN